MASKAELVALLRECLDADADGETFGTDLRHNIKAALMAAKPEEKTVRVRACVMVNADGCYVVVGGLVRKPEPDEAEPLDVSMARDFGPALGVHSTHWIEADVPLPVVRTVEGEVVK